MVLPHLPLFFVNQWVNFDRDSLTFCVGVVCASARMRTCMCVSLDCFVALSFCRPTYDTAVLSYRFMGGEESAPSPPARPRSRDYPCTKIPFWGWGQLRPFLYWPTQKLCSSALRTCQLETSVINAQPMGFSNEQDWLQGVSKQESRPSHL